MCLGVLHEYDLHSKPKKCWFHMQKIEFFGFMVILMKALQDTSEVDLMIFRESENMRMLSR